MRFDSVRVVRYGRLEELDTGDAPLPSIVVVLGPNESGKSTFFSLLTTLLYGFRPANVAGHPYAPWDGERPEAKASIRLDDGGEMEVHRRLLARSGWTQTTVDGRTDDLRNRALPFASHVSLDVFRQVYAISLPDLAALKDESWERVQDRLTGAMGATDVRPARVVAGEFLDFANGLWRPDQRGKPLARELSAEVRRLGERRREALKSDGELRRLVGERADAQARLEGVLAARERDEKRRRVLEDRLNRLRPVARKRDRIAELREQAGDGALLDGVPSNPAERLDELERKRREADGRIAECDSKAKGAQDRVGDYEERHRRVAEAAGQLREAARRIVELPELEAEAEAAERDVAHAARLCEERARGVFSAPWGEWDDAETGALRALPVAELGSRVEAYQSLTRQRRRMEAGLEGELAGLRDAEAPGRWRLAAGLPVTLAAAAVFALLYFPDAVPPWAAFLTGLDRETALAASGLLAFVGAVLVATWLQDRARVKRRERDSVGAESRGASRIEAVAEAEGVARREVAALVANLPVLPEMLEAPEAGLAAAIEAAAEAADALAERKRALRERRERVEETRGEIERVLGVAGLEPAAVEASAAAAETQDAAEAQDAAEVHDAADGPKPHLDPDVLLRRLEEALRARKDAEAAQQELARTEGERSSVVEERDAATAALEELSARLSKLGDGDARRGAAAAATMMEARDRAERLEEELRREHAELDQLLAEVGRAEAEGERWDELDEVLASLDARLREAGEEARRLQGEVAGLDAKVGRMQEAETADQVAGRIGEVEERLRDAKRRRDRAFLLGRVVQEADRRFREENQPALLRRAGEHMRSVTGGRYDQIELADGGSGSFQLCGPAEPIPRKVEGSVSQGTREQVYLALRLAIVDHLDAGEETLPLFMDEVLVNWDAVRRDRALDLLERVSRKRQVFFFTCHPAMAAELEDRGGAILPLEG